ncbi:TetR/AcrR family transcriptional regulator [Candidatus Nitrotoga sp. M5]|uniref:TetR/AcrR family transcriptional regulator n=1 Tax=Candidatus Nitrotoga sp. M5 TaxID=2890409 RepID=UPI001EF1F2E8|nr:TetR/AcrR family transcriptional regulator [Candidatus Nitrotoga sp. M5]CAH1385357.1 TetR family transcriptional regulator [Candidatus Nitrotoga sp. M5]
MSRTARFNRQVALNSAVALFWSRGYYASSMKDIEKALDMRPGSLYATFGSKSGLFAEALEAYATRTCDDFDQIIEESPSVIDGLQRYLRSFAQPCSSDAQAPAQACMLIKTLLEVNAEDAALRSQVDAMLLTIEQKFCEVLKQAQTNGELRTDVECPRLARLLQTQIIGLRAFAERNVPSDQIEALAEDMAGLLDTYRTG